MGLAGVAISAVGALALVRPSRRQPAARTRRAALGVALYLPLLLAYAQIHLVLDLGQPSPYFERMADASRVLVRSVELVLLAGITLLLRPNARALAARCAILRTGRVDRQTLMAVAVSALLGILGDLLRLASAHAGDHLEVLAQVLGIAGVSIVVIASALLTIGLLGVAVDCVRIASALLRTGRRLGQFVSLVDLAHARQAQRPAP
ncbi:MAG: hypothetical protein KatS3mg103_0778 [Phycisphaerales bacterium]|nr:MAG: hypothetical protein KatS3mg103_0778 [Phycisphaerales bacterium]